MNNRWGRVKNNEISFTPELLHDSDSGFRKINTCEVVNNRIYFYSDIDTEPILELNKNIRETVNDCIHRQIVEDVHDNKIFLHIQSFGGDMFCGFSAMDEILKSKIPIHTIVDGCCASAATFLSVVGSRRFMNQHSYMLIHQVRSGFWGKYDELNDHMESMEKIMQMITDVYLQYTKLPKEKLQDILKHDLWFTPEECLKYGMVDEII
jgi:ATP-dependent Clp endopeptidase proteolytic subunit ClpP